MNENIALNKQIERIKDLVSVAGRPFRGLIVDDEPWVGSVLQGFCEVSPGLEVDVCFNGLEALEKLKTTSYDFITVDLVMPELSGVETVQRILQIDTHVPIMIVTGNATEGLKRQAGCAGARRILEKPVDITDFMTEVADLLESSAGVT
ncbi:response regulator [Gemmatimonas aurantiaca]|nr:response regulator [Gemmatimonas aurantiaca]